MPWLAALPLVSGCVGNRIIYPVLPTPEELREFAAAGPADLQTDMLGMDALPVAGPYSVVSGDLLAVTLPSQVLGEVVEGGAPTVEVKARVQPSGTIHLPLLLDFPVAGKTTGTIEEELASAYHSPERLKERPNVVVTVGEYDTVGVVVIGSVNQPGIHELRSDHRSVMGALMAAGGIKADRGAREIRVLSQNELGETITRLLTVHLENIPLQDVELHGGETVVVEPATDRQFSVIGLVNRSGVFQYPAPRRFNLMQALATAGGVDATAAPRYATIYRVKADGAVIGATFKIDGTSLTDASNVWIKDGDVIAVEHTQGSWLRQFLSQVLGFRANVSVTASGSPTL